MRPGTYIGFTDAVSVPLLRCSVGMRSGLGAGHLCSCNHACLAGAHFGHRDVQVEPIGVNVSVILI